MRILKSTHFQGGSLEYKKYYSVLNTKRQRLQTQIKKIEDLLSCSKKGQKHNNNFKKMQEDKVLYI